MMVGLSQIILTRKGDMPMKGRPVYPDLYFIEEMLYNTIGQDPNVYVGEMQCLCENTYEIKICVRGRGRGESLRTILPRSYEHGQDSVLTKICIDGEEEVWSLMPQNNARQVATLFCIALESNTCFMGAMLPEEKFICIVSDITIWIGGERAQLFAQALKREYGYLIRSNVWFKNYRRGCVKEHQLYCGCKRY